MIESIHKSRLFWGGLLCFFAFLFSGGGGCLSAFFMCVSIF